MIFNRFSNAVVASAFNFVTGNDIDRIDAIEIKDALNAGWLDEDTDEIYRMCRVFEKKEVQV